MFYISGNVCEVMYLLPYTYYLLVKLFSVDVLFKACVFNFKFMNDSQVGAFVI